ncbi:MAG TPA: DUF2884 family protein [Rhodanobacter sp.]|nr:DUF2884 family protein [Rhodanobacter sp.]
MKLRSPACTALLCVLLAACSHDSGTTIAGDNGNIHLRDGVAVIQVTGQPDASVNGNGELRIGSKPVALTADQRDLLKQYYVSVYKIRSEGVATGKAGAALAGQAVGSVMSRLAHGDTDRIGKDIQAQAGKVTAQAAAICDGLEQLRATQDAVAAQVAAFRPYATLDKDRVAKCKQGLDEANRSLATQ